MNARESSALEDERRPDARWSAQYLGWSRALRYASGEIPTRAGCMPRTNRDEEQGET